MQQGQLCMNYFKNGSNIPSSEAYTRKFIEMINTIEKNKQNSIAYISEAEGSK